jgi:hypothetical protein
MPTRAEVYACIDHELEYAERRWQESCRQAGTTYRPDSTKETEEWLIFIKGYFLDAVNAAAHKPAYVEALHCVRKLAGLCFSCLLAHGAARRQVPNTEIVTPLELQGPLTKEQVRELIDGERDYQDQLGPDRTWGHDHTVPGYLCMFDRYLRNAIDAWTDNAGDRAALINIRKLAGITVHCMEDHGALYRD